MDPFSQGILGATASSALGPKKREIGLVALAGFLGGLAADLDILIRSEENPLLYLQFHRQFTHSFVFIPVASLLLNLLMRPLLKKCMSFWRSYFFIFVGYATHGLLDACTSYGTQLLWPFSDLRVAWNLISVVDPFFTLPLALLLALYAYKKQVRWARLGILFALLYLFMGFIQHQRAETELRRLAQSRGHRLDELEVKPSFANLILWKGLYRSGERLYVDAIRLTQSSKIYEGESIALFDIEENPLAFPEDSLTYLELKGFSWFSKGFTALDPRFPNTVSDVRYSLVPNQIAPLWGMRFDPNHPHQHTQFLNFRSVDSANRKVFWQMLLGN